MLAFVIGKHPGKQLQPRHNLDIQVRVGLLIENNQCALQWLNRSFLIRTIGPAFKSENGVAGMPGVGYRGDRRQAVLTFGDSVECKKKIPPVFLLSESPHFHFQFPDSSRVKRIQRTPVRPKEITRNSNYNHQQESQK